MRVLPVAVPVSITACMTAKAFNMRKLGEVKQRAAFDLRCDEQALTFTPLAKAPYNDDVIAPYGVDGCGHHAVYVHTPSGWVMNTVDGTIAGTSAAKAAPASQPAP